ncbi:S1-like domain-containing RNA-binding protein [Alkalimonas delamerensis]|uniref:S1-like domain-containing RNA-binding protein n=1 Tax=Alkalimonas delamerensis TaxID=265981 RepID=A0ABT9GPE2_9GAMM|nr:S1-like domain-containing RNA-binding protein [Alkalimonas delamerensis]MDP4528847.1 S1-like domain-containing RNA-binding protein [Alkalimonas delamerensis]
MLALGKQNRLAVKKEVDFGYFLDGLEWGDILLPKRYAPAGLEIGQLLNVFLYLDSDDQLIATTEIPKIQVGQFALLTAVDVNKVGAFLDWGLSKDLLVPYSEQPIPMQTGKRYLVHCLVDKSNRIIGSAKLDKFLDKVPASYQEKQTVSVIIANHTDLGYKAIINQQHWGLLFKDQLKERLYPGQQLTAYIRQVRPDGKIDLSLNPIGAAKATTLEPAILEALQQAGGFLPLHDKSSPEAIYQQFSASKKAFKQAIGRLFKAKKIRIEQDGIYLA